MSQKIYCSSCGAEMLCDDAFCSECGAAYKETIIKFGKLDCDAENEAINEEIDVTDLDMDIQNTSISEAMNKELRLINERFGTPLIKKIPITEMAGLGTAFASLAEMIPHGAGVANGVVENGGLFRCVFPEGVTGHLFKSAGQRLGGIAVDGGGLAQARFIPVAEEAGTAAVVSNPEVLLIAVAIMGITVKINEIQKGQEKIIGILERDKKSQLIADYELLQDYLADYKYYFENDATMTVNLNQVKNIKRNALKDVRSYHEELTEKVDNKNNILKLVTANGEIKGIFDRFVHYKLAISVYSMASYLEVMLSKNFQAEYLDKETDVMQKIASEYEKIYLSCNTKLSELKTGSLGAKATKGLSWLSKNAGNAISKIPVIEKGPVDEVLIAGSDKLNELDAKALNDMLEFFEEYKDCAALPVADHIESLKTIANRNTEILTDGNTMYIFSECIA